MARAFGAAAPGSASACGVVLLELLGSICVSTNEVGGLLKKGGFSGLGFRRPPFSTALINPENPEILSKLMTGFQDSTGFTR